MEYEKIENQFPEVGQIYRFTNHGKNKSSFTFHAKQKCPFTRHEKSVGDPHYTCCYRHHETGLHNENILLWHLVASNPLVPVSVLLVGPLSGSWLAVLGVLTCARISILQIMCILGGAGGQNLLPPVPCSPASHTFNSRLPLFSVLLPTPVNWQSIIIIIFI